MAAAKVVDQGSWIYEKNDIEVEMSSKEVEEEFIYKSCRVILSNLPSNFKSVSFL